MSRKVIEDLIREQFPLVVGYEEAGTIAGAITNPDFFSLEVIAL
jgi:hypothetical protein